jgi:hypothetical protein
MKKGIVKIWDIRSRETSHQWTKYNKRGGEDGDFITPS